MMIQYPDYRNCTTNIPCSVLAHFGITPDVPTFAPMDKLLCEKEYKNIVVMLLDGMGTNVMEKHLSPDGFFRQHFICNMSSTFPPTTVASTTSVLSGLYPSQTAWLGWVGYFPDIQRNIIYFLNKDNDDKEAEFSENIANKYLPYENIIDRLNSAGKKAYIVSKFAEGGENIKCFDDICRQVENYCAKDGRKYIYAYCDEPDATLHHEGIGSAAADKVVNELEAAVKALADKLEDTLLMIISDHGHINIENKTLTDYPDICECLLRMPSIEARAVNMFVMPDKKELLPKLFKKHFGREFLVLSKEEVLERQLFGEGTPHPRFEEMLGDYLAVAVGNTALNTYARDYKSNHAGLTPEEMTIPFIAVKR